MLGIFFFLPQRFSFFKVSILSSICLSLINKDHSANFCTSLKIDLFLLHFYGTWPTIYFWKVVNIENEKEGNADICFDIIVGQFYSIPCKMQQLMDVKGNHVVFCCWLIVDVVFVCSLEYCADIFQLWTWGSLAEACSWEARIGAHVQISIGFITGFLMCLILAPGSLGLKGARAPYGFGKGRVASASGM